MDELNGNNLVHSNYDNKLGKNMNKLFKNTLDEKEPSGYYGGIKGETGQKSIRNSKTPALDSYSRDLTNLAESGILDPIIGRDQEIERVSQVLSRRKKSNPVLIGDPGVGKSAIAEGLAIRIIERKVSKNLLNKRILSLDIGSLVAGTKYRGQFEERMKTILEELRNNKDIIIFIDELHTVVGAGGSSGSLDAANMFKPALARGEIQCIGATTLDEYRQHIEKDGALERRFQKILIIPPTHEETIEILKNVKEKYEAHHNVTYTEEAIENCVSLTGRYITERNFPDKALDALDEAGSRAQLYQVKVPKSLTDSEDKLAEITGKKKEAVSLQDYEEAAKLRDLERKLRIGLEVQIKTWEDSLNSKRKLVDGERVCEVVSMMTGIPLSKINQDENSKLANLEEILKGRVIGQDEAIIKTSRAIRRNRIGLKDPNRPIGSFIFLGPTGVGKTELAKILAEIVFGDKESLIRVDMSEYMDKFNSTKLIGAPPGYVGHDSGGQLTEKVRRKPYSIILFDEIEKAHPDIFNVMLQILDEGFITDGLGRKIDFKNTLIIMTSNIGQRKAQEFGTGLGFASNDRGNFESIIKKELNKHFSPEFLNRIDDLILFNHLKENDLELILDNELTKMNPRFESLGIRVNIKPDLRKEISRIGYDPKFGARPLKRTIQKYVEDTIANIMVNGTIEEGSLITLSYDINKKDGLDLPIKIRITKSKK
jgi:ATP-dependent Clp protease ATP-binding subunit ClpC